MVHGDRAFDQRRPRRQDHLRLVVRQDARQLGHLVEARRRQVRPLGRVGLHVEEPHGCWPLRDLELPVVGEHGAIVAGAPEEGLVRMTLRVAAHELHEIDAVDRAIGGHRHAGRRRGSREDVDVRDRRMEAGAARQARRPLREERRMHAAFEEGHLPAAIRAVDVG